MATANAPNTAYDNAVVVPSAMPSSNTLTRYFSLRMASGVVAPASGNAARMVSAGISATMPPIKALMMRLKTTCTRAIDKMSIRPTARTTGFMMKTPQYFI